MSGQEPRSWPDNFYSPEELAEFKAIGQNFTPEQLAAYQKKWAELIAEVKSNLKLPPESPEARKLAERWRQLLRDGFAGHERLLSRIGQAYQQGAVPREHSLLAPEILAFITKAEEAAASKQD